MKSCTFISVLVAFLLFSSFYPAPGKSKSRIDTLDSPDGNLQVEFRHGPEKVILVKYRNRQVFILKDPQMVFRERATDGQVLSVRKRSADQVQEALVREKRAQIIDRYNELTILYRSDYGMILRAYDDGFAYRYFTRFKEDSVHVLQERASLALSSGDSLVLPIIHCRDLADVDCFHTSFEEEYIHCQPADVDPERLAYLPIYTRTSNGVSIAFTESDLYDYPGMFVSGSETDNSALLFRFPAFPLEVSVHGDPFKQELVTRRADYIAKTTGTRDYPWRVFIVGEHDRDLVNSDMVYRLASPCRLKETDWIRPGQITDEWIINSILYGVDFRSGINTSTYKYYVDFASRFGLDYVFLDAGWSDINNLTRLNPDVDLPEILKYATEKQVGIWLWTCALTLKNNMPVLKQFSSWGIRGIMVDFMDREDQVMVRFQERVAKETAENKLMVLFHGASKPTGLRKAFPNVVSREGVAGHEFNKWTDRITPDHDLTIPFTRMIAGPLDYEAGGMVNAQKDAFRIVDPVPMTQGTRIHQLAMYVIYESPLQYLAGSISDYIREPDYAIYFGKIPTVWDETQVLNGRISDFILVARRNGNNWWVGAMTDWTPRSMELDLSFLGNGSYMAEIYRDGINADQYAGDYKRDVLEVNRLDKLLIQMAPGGGWIGHFQLQ